MARVVPSQVVNLIDHIFPWAATQKDDQVMRIFAEHDGTLGAIAAMVATIPDELLPLPPKEASTLNVALWTVRAQLESWRAHGKAGSLDKTKGVDPRNPVTVLRELLAKCPDEPVLHASRELSFVKDPDLRRSLLADLAAVSRALSNGEWKAATVLGGSSLEALLLWAATEVERRDAKSFNQAVSAAAVRAFDNKHPPDVLDKWDLHHLIEVCLEVKVITSDTATQARLAKDFRNLIHPGRAIRLSASCNNGTAMAASAALAFAALDLAKAFP